MNVENISYNTTSLLLIFSIIGIYLTSQEWINIWSRGTLVGLGRLMMLNLPIVILINLYLLGEI